MVQTVEVPCAWCGLEAKDSDHSCRIGKREFVLCEACFPLMWQLTSILKSLKSAVSSELGGSRALTRPYV